ncbi:zinc finger, C3HC4 type [Ostertagia ostertagi]
MEPLSGEDLAETSAKSSTEVEPSSSASKTTQSMEDSDDHHMCRVCRGEDGHLYYPCLCTGSIKYVHQECLTEWLKYSKKEVCELCNYKYSFQPIYRHDMPKALPLVEILKGVVVNAAVMLRTWLVYTMVLVSWLGIVPLTAARIYHAVFYLSMQEILVLPLSIFRTEHIFPDVFKGCFLLIIFICTFISLVWLREQIIHGGPHDFLNIEQADAIPNGVVDQELQENHGERVVNAGEQDEVDVDHLQPQPAAAQPGVEIPAEDNWRDLDRLGDELTWQRLLGLDGSLVFLERVVWVISLDTLFTIMFAYAPYKLGYFILSKKLFSASLSSRAASFAASPTSSVFIHWMIGMVYVFYFASFVLLLREVLRPGVLWFMRNLNDPEFNPIQEMIELPVTRHLRRLVASTSLCFTTIFLIVYVPLCIVQKLYPSLLPYNMSLSADTPLSELSLELLILQVVLPALLEQTQARFLLKAIVLWWCVHIGRALSLDRYLLPDLPNAEQPADGAGVQGAGGLAAEHQALLLLREPQAFQPYTRPRLFPLRILVLLGAMALTCCFTSCVLFLVPVTVGRTIIHNVTGYTNVHELYTVGTGLYICWMLVKTGLLSLHWFHLGVHHLKEAFVNSINLVSSSIAGDLYSYCVRHSDVDGDLFSTRGYYSTEVIFPTDFIDLPLARLGYGSIAHENCMRSRDDGAGVVDATSFDSQRYTQIRLRHLRATFILGVISFTCSVLKSLLAFPYLIARFYIFVTNAPLEESVLVLRYCFPSSLILLLVVSFLRWQLNKIQGLAENIRNEKYLVGTRLVNYERNGLSPVPTEAAISS